MMSPSSATVSVPAGAPKSKTEVKTKVSETERLAGIEGSLTVADPLITVRAARYSQLESTVPLNSSKADFETAKAPATITDETYSFAVVDRGFVAMPFQF